MLVCGAKVLDLGHPLVMGVLNVTPDSFSDGGRFRAREQAIAHGLKLIEQGAAIVDVGGESTRPGATPVSVQEELDRVIPVIEALAGASAVISIDTSEPAVMKAAVTAGAGLINDVRALLRPGALACAAALPAAICLMHMQGEPATMQRQPTYSDVVTEVKAFLLQRAQACLAAGVVAERLLVDPGFGFGKTFEHNLDLLRRLKVLSSLPWPCVVGLSRKSMVGTITGRPMGARDPGSIALALIAVQRGARIVRAHDVAGTVAALRILAAIENGD